MYPHVFCLFAQDFTNIFHQFLPVSFPKVKADWLFLLQGLVKFLESHVTILFHHLTRCVQFFFRPIVDKRSAGKLQFPHFAKITVPGTVCSNKLLCIFSVMTNSAQPFWIYLPYRRYNRHPLHQQVKLLLRNGHGLFLGSWPTEASRGKPFVYEQISVSFKNEAFDPVCLCPTEQEQDIFLRRIQLKLFLHNCSQSIDTTSQISTPTRNDDAAESSCVIQQGASVLSADPTAPLTPYWTTPVPSAQCG